MEAQDRKLEEILNSLDGIKKPAVNPFLFEKIKLRMELRGEEMPKTVVTKWAIALTMIVMLNLFTWVQLNTRNVDAADDLQILATEYGFNSVSYKY